MNDIQFSYLYRTKKLRDNSIELPLFSGWISRRRVQSTSGWCGLHWDTVCLRRPWLCLLSLLFLPLYPFYPPSTDVQQHRHRDAQPNQKHCFNELVNLFLSSVTAAHSPLKVVFGSDVSFAFTFCLSPIPCPLTRRPVSLNRQENKTQTYLDRIIFLGDTLSIFSTSSAVELFFGTSRIPRAVFFFCIGIFVSRRSILSCCHLAAFINLPRARCRW